MLLVLLLSLEQRTTTTYSGCLGLRVVRGAGSKQRSAHADAEEKAPCEAAVDGGSTAHRQATKGGGGPP